MNNLSTLSDLVRANFTCSITREIPKHPVICPCGHLFEFVDIVQWININNTCPISRRALNFNDLIVPTFIVNFLEAISIGENSQSLTTQTGEILIGDDAIYTSIASVHLDTMSESSDDDVPALINILPPQIERPFVALVDYSIAAQDLTPADRIYLGRDRLVDLFDGLFNPQSGALRVGPTVERFNQAYVEKLITRSCTHPHMVIRKYAYVSRSPSLVETARLLARQGFYVYDIFLINSNHFQHNYVVLSTDVKDDGTPNQLNRYRH